MNLTTLPREELQRQLREIPTIETRLHKIATEIAAIQERVERGELTPRALTELLRERDGLVLRINRLRNEGRRALIDGCPDETLQQRLHVLRNRKKHALAERTQADRHLELQRAKHANLLKMLDSGFRSGWPNSTSDVVRREIRLNECTPRSERVG